MESNLRYSGMNIRAVLDTQGRRQDWLAEQVGISDALLSMAINGKRTLGADVAKRIATVLGVPFFVIFESPIGRKRGPIGNEETAA